MSDHAAGRSRRRRAVLALLATLVAVAVAVVVVVVLVSRGGEDPAPEVDETLVADIEGTGLTPYEIDLRDARVVEVQADPKPDDGGPPIDISYELGDQSRISVFLLPAPGKPRACDTSDGSTCEIRDGVMVSTFEEMSNVSTVHGDTLLAVAFTSESDPDIIDDVVDAVRGATEVTPRELAAGASID